MAVPFCSKRGASFYGFLSFTQLFFFVVLLFLVPPRLFTVRTTDLLYKDTFVEKQKQI